jgi:hypothetical protein
MKTEPVRQTVWQPEFDDNAKVVGHENEDSPFSFEVWHQKKNLLKVYPNCNPEEYDLDGIEEPTFMDSPAKNKKPKTEPVNTLSNKENNLCIIPGYGNILAKVDNWVTDTCIYLRVLTGELKGGLINMAKGEFIEIPDSSTIKIRQLYIYSS